MKTETLLFIAAGVLIATLLFSEGNFMPKTIYDNIAQAIMRFEGYFKGSTSYINNNPGNLKYAGQPAASGQDARGFAIFPTFQDGYSALIAQVKAMLNGSHSLYPSSMTLVQAFNRYSTTSQNTYGNFVAEQLGVSPDITLAELNAMAV